MIVHVDEQIPMATLAHPVTLTARGIKSEVPQPVDHGWNVPKFAETTGDEQRRGQR